jgi:hypothetical protein
MMTLGLIAQFGIHLVAFVRRRRTVQEGPARSVAAAKVVKSYEPQKR